MVTADEARRLRVNKGNVNHETYKEIYGKVSGRIKSAATRGETSLEYRIPPLIPGRPMYNISHAVRYNSDKLRNAGFEVSVDGDLLRINWSTDNKPQQTEKKAKKVVPPAVIFPKSSATISQSLQDLKNKLKW